MFDSSVLYCMNDRLIVHGGKKLKGDYKIQGSKNEAFEVMCACLLTKETVVIKNIPNIVDVTNLINVFKLLNVKVEKINDHDYSFCAKDMFNVDQVDFNVLKSFITQLRGGVMILGPMVARFKKAIIPMPGGDKIGRRRLDTHFYGLSKLNVVSYFDEKLQSYVCTTDQLKGNYILLDESSVTGTANIILAAVLAQGTTTIYNAACEPHVQQLCNMLNKMGAKISGVGSNKLIITGVESLGGVEHVIGADLLDIGSIIGLAALTRSNINIKFDNCDETWLYPAISRFQKIGIKMNVKADGIFVYGEKEYEVKSDLQKGAIVKIDDAVWPGFPSDLLCILLVTSLQAKGSVLFYEKLYESRLFFVDNLIAMGAKIILCDPHRAHVIGINHEYPLRGIKIASPDIRTGMSLLLAALSAEGESVISQLSIIKRGYENIVERLKSLGADIEEE